ncbi:MAG: hypothetical protein AVDCRST_MAG15-2680, partial [uncultured Rubellimicrobium sp.]
AHRPFLHHSGRRGAGRQPRHRPGRSHARAAGRERAPVPYAALRLQPGRAGRHGAGGHSLRRGDRHLRRAEPREPRRDQPEPLLARRHVVRGHGRKPRPSRPLGKHGRLRSEARRLGPGRGCAPTGSRDRPGDPCGSDGGRGPVLRRLPRVLPRTAGL